MEADSDSGSTAFHLEPFIHQVGGHSSMLQLDENTICKPLVAQELQFYQKSPDSLKKFMPEFKGIVEVAYNTDNEGYLSLTAYLPPDYKKPSDQHCFLKDKSKTKVKHRIRVCHSGSILIESSAEDGMKQMFEECNQAKEQTTGSPLNPWVVRCHQKQFKRMGMSSFNSSQKYLLLENLTSKYEFPCILDVKMGTRPYGDDASIAKIQSQIAKNASTTSTALGVRIGGIQVYRHDSGHYICHNKYYGRGLTVDGFHQALYHFLHNGTELRRDVIAQLIHKLQKLKEVIQNLDTFRFFTSSLLITYDGKKHTCCEKHQNKCSCNTSDDVSICENGNMNERDTASEASNSATSEPCGKCMYREQPFPLKKQLSNHDEHESTEQENVVDVKMIDFAHSTQNGMAGSQNTHIGPDDGYLLGLENLILQLKTFHQGNN